MPPWRSLGLVEVPGLEQRFDHHVEGVAAFDVQGRCAGRRAEQLEPLPRVLDRGTVAALTQSFAVMASSALCSTVQVIGPAGELEPGPRRLLHLLHLVVFPGDPGLVQPETRLGDQVVLGDELTAAVEQGGERTRWVGCR